MIKVRYIFSSVFLPLLAVCSVSPPSYPVHIVGRPWVYSIKPHGDSLYFSTLQDGVFRFHPDSPDTIASVGRYRLLPFRSIAFPPDGRLLASSYYAGVFYAEWDSLFPVKYAPYDAWSMKLDERGDFWLAGTRGVMRQRGDSVAVFNRAPDAHDVAFFGRNVAVAHMRGISLYDRESGARAAEYCKGVVCWTLATFDSVLVGGGSGVCAVIGAHGCRLIRVPPKGNMPWSVAKDSLGAIFMATQQGLFCAGPQDSVARCVALPGRCVKSVVFDKAGRLWAGTFYR
jgi:hypothetical protein